MFFLFLLLVTECICTLCLCCCTLYVTLSVSVSSFFFYWMWGRSWTSFICNNSFTASRMYHQRKVRNLWLWLVCCSLLPTCNFHRAFAIIIRRGEKRGHCLICPHAVWKGQTNQNTFYFFNNCFKWNG